MWYVRDVLYAVLYVRVSCFVVCGCGVSRRYVDVCYCDMFSVVNMYLDHLKFCVVYINRYVCCSECNVVSNECNEPTSCLVQPIGAHCCEVMYFGCFGFRGELGFLNCDDVLCCLPTPMTLASGGSPMFPHVVHQPASPSIWLAVQSLRRGLSTNPGVTMWCVCGCS